MSDHGAAMIKDWMRDLIGTARTESDFETSAGAEPGRSYAYLEYHRPDGSHSCLLFVVDQSAERALLCTYRFDGSADQVREKINALVPPEDRPSR